MIITTSRKPSRHCIALAKDLSKSFPGSIYFSRGKKPIEAIAEKANYEAREFALIVSEMHGLPNEISILEMKQNEWKYFASIRIKLLKPRKELSPFKSKINELKTKLENAKLKKLFKELGIISENDSEFSLIEKNNQLTFFRENGEIGPRIEIKGIQYE